MLPLPSYRLPSKTKRGEHCSTRSISRKGKEKDICTKSVVYNLESRALERHRMSKTITSREVPSELFSEMVQLHPGDLGLWDSHQIKSQSSNISELWNRTDRNTSPKGTLGVEVGEHFYSVTQQNFFSVNNFLYFSPWLPKTQTLAPWKESYDKLSVFVSAKRHHFADKGLYSQIYGFSSSHERMWELHHKEGWNMRKWCFQTVVLEKTRESLGLQED